MVRRMTNLRMTTTILTRIQETVTPIAAQVKFWRLGPLEDFDQNQPLAVRTRWLEKFQSGKGYYCKLKTKTPDSEYNYTTFQRKSETPREFYYRLNKIADKEDIDIKSTDIACDGHLKMFIKKLKDIQLRLTLQGQRVRGLKDLDQILKQHEEIWWSDDREAHPLKGHDRNSDSTFGNRQRQKTNNRAYNANEGEAFASDDEQQALLDQGMEGVNQKNSR
ncbi:hypothetical protein PHMEG_00037073 [Phytophthora megakarya]|uniref:Retrotransposon gag domain-containing protein n=1 Tax=Phytophthora megakarya TaxID=4795 RepID=A0A225UKN6_9STRA|nr:hypothetical protein PHMEG_00037073 [Phytophthora megakarya]